MGYNKMGKRYMPLPMPQQGQGRYEKSDELSNGGGELLSSLFLIYIGSLKYEIKKLKTLHDKNTCYICIKGRNQTNKKNVDET